MRKENEDLHLECILTDQEKLDYSKELAENISKKARSEESLKSFQTQMKAEIASCDAKINLMAEKLNTGKEYRMVDCKIEYRFKTNTKIWTRLDTMETLKECAIPAEEMQEELA